MNLVKKISLRQFAKIAGVSPATVSRVFQQSAKVSKEKYDRIMKLAEQTGFRPNPIARVAFGEKTRSVGVLLSDLTHTYFGKIACGIQHAMLQEDYLPIILSVTGDSEAALRRMMDHRVDGLVIGFSDEQIDIGRVLGGSVSDLPIVILEHPRRGIICDSVFNDDTGGGRQAAEHFIRLGHKRFGFCYFGEGGSNCDLRLQGFREALAKAGLIMSDDNIARQLPHIEDRDEYLNISLKQILGKKDRPTAFFASTDNLALKVYKAAREMKLRIPQDLSVIGFANLEFTEFLEPPLTTIAQSPYDLGIQAAILIIKRLKSEDVEKSTIIIPTKLLERESCAKNRG